MRYKLVPETVDGDIVRYRRVPIMSLAQAKAIVGEIGFTLTKRDGEYRLAPKAGAPKEQENEAHYTDDLCDAVSTAKYEHGRAQERALTEEADTRLAAGWLMVEA